MLTEVLRLTQIAKCNFLTTTPPKMNMPFSMYNMRLNFGFFYENLIKLIRPPPMDKHNTKMVDKKTGLRMANPNFLT